jgi:hypothetical protein
MPGQKRGGFPRLAALENQGGIAKRLQVEYAEHANAIALLMLDLAENNAEIDALNSGPKPDGEKEFLQSAEMVRPGWKEQPVTARVSLADGVYLPSFAHGGIAYRRKGRIGG